MASGREVGEGDNSSAVIDDNEYIDSVSSFSCVVSVVQCSSQAILHIEQNVTQALKAFVVLNKDLLTRTSG